LLQSKQPAFFPKKESSKRIPSQHTTPRNIIEFLKTSKIMIEKKIKHKRETNRTNYSSQKTTGMFLSEPIFVTNEEIHIE
jgi:hypothetical protein